MAWGIRKRRSQEVGVACPGIGTQRESCGVGEVLQAEVGLAGAGEPLQEALHVSGELRGGPGSRASTAGGGTGVQRPTRSGRGIYVEGLSPKVEPRRVEARTNQMRARGLWAQEAGWVGALDERVLTGAEL